MKFIFGLIIQQIYFLNIFDETKNKVILSLAQKNQSEEKLEKEIQEAIKKTMNEKTTESQNNSQTIQDENTEQKQENKNENQDSKDEEKQNENQEKKILNIGRANLYLRNENRNKTFFEELLEDLNSHKQEIMQQNCPLYQFVNLEKQTVQDSDQQVLQIPQNSIMIWQVEQNKNEDAFFINNDIPTYEDQNYSYQILYYVQSEGCIFYNNNQIVKSKIYIPQLVLISNRSPIPNNLPLQNVRIFVPDKKETQKFSLQIGNRKKLILDQNQFVNKKQEDYQIYNYKPIQKKQISEIVKSIVYPQIFKEQNLIPVDAIYANEELDYEGFLIYKMKLPQITDEMREYFYQPFYYLKMSNILNLKNEVLSKILVLVYILTENKMQFLKEIPNYIIVPKLEDFQQKEKLYPHFSPFYTYEIQQKTSFQDQFKLPLNTDELTTLRNIRNYIFTQKVYQNRIPLPLMNQYIELDDKENQAGYKIKLMQQFLNEQTGINLAWNTFKDQLYTERENIINSKCTKIQVKWNGEKFCEQWSNTDNQLKIF